MPFCSKGDRKKNINLPVMRRIMEVGYPLNASTTIVTF